MMDAISLNADREHSALVRSQETAWAASPETGVHRMMLERDGGERARATTIVRFLPGSRFSPHVHEQGEEFFVLEGVFSDEHGHHGPGTYVRNPPGSRHAPYSRDGCTLFVKLRQMDEDQTVARTCVTPLQRVWAGAGPGMRCATLHADGKETVGLLEARPGCTIASCALEAGEEILLVQGSMSIDEAGARPLVPWSWWRNPSRRRPALVMNADTLLLIKRMAPA